MLSHQFTDEAFALAQEALGDTPEASDLAMKIKAVLDRSAKAHAAALDEVYLLRALCAYEGRVLEVHTGYASFPKSRRDAAAASLARLSQAAAGDVDVATAALNVKQTLRMADLPETLTAASYAEEKGVTA